ncbi:MAG: hypothetical protein PHU97_10385 [Bacteroidales bacterium]|nr:hypothetical protein [Bacteroidales bacterium]
MEQAWVVGDFAQGKDSPIIDLLLVGKNIDIAYLSTLIEKTEALIHRRIRYIILNGKEVKENLKTFSEALLLFKR